MSYFELRLIAVYRLDAIAYGVVVVGLHRLWPEWLNRMRWGLFATGLILVWLATATGRVVELALLPLAMALCLPAMLALPRPWPFVDATVRWLSTRSYGAYLIHFDMLWLGVWLVKELGWINPWIRNAGALAATFVLAELLYRYFERPILALRPAQFPPEGNAARPTPLEGRQPVAG
jgi:peptidoglycan/LPS O-acetylase OafA/YrhL